MTEKEKAKELVDVFIPFSDASNPLGHYSDSVALANAKQCALICVEEILSLKCESVPKENNPHHYYSREYWQQVKQEIEKL